MIRSIFLKELLLAVFKCIGISWDKTEGCLNDGNAYFNKCTFSRLYKESFLKVMRYAITAQTVIVKKRNSKRQGEYITLDSDTVVFRLSEYIYGLMGIDIYRYYKYYLVKTECKLSCAELIMTIVEKVITPQLFKVSKTDNKENGYGCISVFFLKQLTIRCLQDMLNDNLTGFKIMHIPVVSEIELGFKFKDFYSDIVQADEEIHGIVWERGGDAIEINECVVKETEEIEKELTSVKFSITNNQICNFETRIKSIFNHNKEFYMKLNKVNLIACYKQILIIYKKVFNDIHKFSDGKYIVSIDYECKIFWDLHVVLIRLIFLLERIILEKWKIAYPQMKETADEMNYDYLDVVGLYDYEMEENSYE